MPKPPIWRRDVDWADELARHGLQRIVTRITHPDSLTLAEKSGTGKTTNERTKDRPDTMMANIAKRPTG
jgi:hypothetical protein